MHGTRLGRSPDPMGHILVNQHAVTITLIAQSELQAHIVYASAAHFVPVCLLMNPYESQEFIYFTIL